VEFAKNHPEWLRDIDADRLGYLLPSAIVEKIQALPPRTRGVRFQIKSTQTGKVYQSMREAERHEFLSRAAISAALKEGRTTRDGVGYQLVQRGR
jgi:hypothetical protein